MSRLDEREQAMIILAKEFQGLMEQNDSLRVLIEAAHESGEMDDLKTMIKAINVFKQHAAQMIGSLAMVCGQIDNTSASRYLCTVAKEFTEYHIENDPMDVLRGITEQP